MAIPIIVTYRILGRKGGVQSASSPTNKLSSSRATQVTSSDGMHVTDVVARNNCCKLYLCMDMELLPRLDHF